MSTARIIDELINAWGDAPKLRAFLNAHSFPLVQDSHVTFVWIGQADAVNVRHWVYGLASSQNLQRVQGTQVWYLTFALPPASRVEYKFEVIRDGHGEWIQDPLNPNLARDPFGANSVAHGEGYQIPK